GRYTTLRNPKVPAAVHRHRAHIAQFFGLPWTLRWPSTRFAHGGRESFHGIDGAKLDLMLRRAKGGVERHLAAVHGVTTHCESDDALILPEPACRAVPPPRGLVVHHEISEPVMRQRADTEIENDLPARLVRIEHRGRRECHLRGVRRSERGHVFAALR